MFHHSVDKDHFEVMKADHITRNEIPESTRNNDIEEQIEEERKEEEIRAFKTSYETTHDPNAIVPTAASVYLATDVVDRGDKNAILNSIVQIYNKEHHKHNKLRKTMKKLSE